MSIIECKNLVPGYDGKAVAPPISFSVNHGDYLCIVGENGSGKSTLMKTILSLLPPVSGEIHSDKRDLKSEIGYLPQQTDVQRDFPASVWEIVLSGCRSASFKPFYNKNDKLNAKTNMEKMRITSLSKKCYRELSGGQQQRVLLARALCAAKSILLLDEPVSGLDPKVTDEMYDLIYSLNRNDKKTVIMISHDMKASLKYASHILHIGNNIFFGTKDEYLKNSGSFFSKGDDLI